MNPIGLIGFTVSVSAAFFLGMLVENFRASIALRRRSKYKFRFKPRKVPQEPEEWSVKSSLQADNERLRDKIGEAVKYLDESQDGKALLLLENALRATPEDSFNLKKIVAFEEDCRNKLQNMQIAPSDMFETACRKIVQENPGKF